MGHHITFKQKALVSALLLELTTVCSAATIIVDGSTCSLVDAIAAANTDSAQGGCIAGSGEDTLELPDSGNFVLTTALPLITSSVTINGNNSSISRDSAAPQFPVLSVDSYFDEVVLNDLTLSGGLEATFGSEARGAGVKASGPVLLTVNRCTITGNTGAAIYARSARVTIQDSVISDNMPTEPFREQSGLVTQASRVEIRRSLFTGNLNGAIWIGTNEATATISETTISGNTSNEYVSAGAITTIGASLMVSDSTISDNINEFNETYGYGYGPGAFSNKEAYQTATGDSMLTITNSTISGNTGGRAGAIEQSISPCTNPDPTCPYETEAHLILNQVTMVGNSSALGPGGIWNFGGNITLRQSIISGNIGPLANEIEHLEGSVPATITVDDYNLFGLTGDAGLIGLAPGPSDAVIMQTMLADVVAPVLADNGGLTLTHAVNLSGPAADFVPAVACFSAVDQTGMARPVDADMDGTADCDAGSVEGVPDVPPELPDGIFTSGFE